MLTDASQQKLKKSIQAKRCDTKVMCCITLCGSVSAGGTLLLA